MVGGRGRKTIYMETLSVCRTCPRESAEKGGVVDALRALAAGGSGACDASILSVECLGGCPRPCTVAFDAPGKWRVRLSGLTARDAADILAAARTYASLPDGRLSDDVLPPALRGRISALSPKGFARPESSTPTRPPRSAPATQRRKP
jgi:predicted metal-binding protein